MSDHPTTLTEEEMRSVNGALDGIACHYGTAADLFGVVERIKADAYAAGLAARTRTATGDDLRDRVTADASWALWTPSVWGSPDERSVPLLLAAIGQALAASPAPVVSRPEAVVCPECGQTAAMHTSGGRSSRDRWCTPPTTTDPEAGGDS